MLRPCLLADRVLGITLWVGGTEMLDIDVDNELEYAGKIGLLYEIELLLYDSHSTSSSSSFLTM